MKLRCIHWPVSPPVPALPEGDEIHVWVAAAIPETSALAEMASKLSPDEQERAARFHQAVDRDRYRFSRALLREWLSGHIGVGPSDVALTCGPAGKPMLATPEGAAPPLVFNVTHTRQLTLIALARSGELGIDAEPLAAGEAWSELAGRVLSRRERAELERLAPALRPAAFLRAWTGKEALLKAVGVGLMDELGDLDLEISPELPARLRAWLGHGERVDTWELESFTPVPDHVATVAYRAATIRR